MKRSWTSAFIELSFAPRNQSTNQSPRLWQRNGKIISERTKCNYYFPFIPEKFFVRFFSKLFRKDPKFRMAYHFIHRLGQVLGFTSYNNLLVSVDWYRWAYFACGRHFSPSSKYDCKSAFMLSLTFCVVTWIALFADFILRFLSVSTRDNTLSNIRRCIILCCGVTRGFCMIFGSSRLFLVISGDS